jgi:hypothetical protein
MVSVVTSVLAGASAAVLVVVVSDHSLAGALVAGAVVMAAVLGAMIRHQNVASTGLRTRSERAFRDARAPADGLGRPRDAGTVWQHPVELVARGDVELGEDLP